MKKLITICGHDFFIEDHEIRYVEVIMEDYDGYNFTASDILLKIIEDHFNDYYLESVYKHIIANFSNIDYLLEGCDEQLKYTDKVLTIVTNCLQNPGGETEFNIIRLFMMFDFKWLKYVDKLNNLCDRLSMVEVLTNNTPSDKFKYVSGKSYNLYCFNIYFDRYNFGFTIEVNGSNADKQKMLMKFEQLPGINIMDSRIKGNEVQFTNQKYEIFDELIKYIEEILMK